MMMEKKNGEYHRKIFSFRFKVFFILKNIMEFNSLRFKLFSNDIFLIDCYTYPEAIKKSKKYSNTKIITERKKFNDFLEYTEWIEKNPFSRKLRK